MSPILVRPVREQFEHDRIIRLLALKAKRRYEAGINPGAEKNVPVGSGPTALYPDLVLQSPDRKRRLEAVVEVETGESVNHLEALAQWAHFGKLRAAFHLYVPAGMVEVARRLCEDNQIHASEIWSYHMAGDEVRFTPVHRSPEVAHAAPRARTAATRPAPRAARKGKKKPTAAARPAKRATPPARVAKKRAKPKKRR